MIIKICSYCVHVKKIHKIKYLSFDRSYFYNKSNKIKKEKRGAKLSKATLYEIKTFDINNGYTFTFDYISTESINGNILRIYKNTDTSEPIITQKQLSKKSNTLSKSTMDTHNMKNGEIYWATITMCTESGELKDTCSDKQRFFCFSTPALSFKKETANMFSSPIKNSSFIVELEFIYDTTGTYQDELNEYNVVVYSYEDTINQLQVYETKRAYATDLNNLTAYITDLEEGKSYYLKAMGNTKHGVNIESEMLRVDILDSAQYIKTALNANVRDDTASVYLSSNLINIDGESEGDISFEDGKVIIGENSNVFFKKDISIESVEHSVFKESMCRDFMLSVQFSNFPIDSEI